MIPVHCHDMVATMEHFGRLGFQFQMYGTSNHWQEQPYYHVVKNDAITQSLHHAFVFTQN